MRRLRGFCAPSPGESCPPAFAWARFMSIAVTAKRNAPMRAGRNAIRRWPRHWAREIRSRRRQVAAKSLSNARHPSLGSRSREHGASLERGLASTSISIGTCRTELRHPFPTGQPATCCNAQGGDSSTSRLFNVIPTRFNVAIGLSKLTLVRFQNSVFDHSISAGRARR